MSEWVNDSLSNLVSFQKGKKVNTSSFQLSDYERYLGAGSLVGGHDGYACSLLSIHADENDVLMLWDGERSGLVGYKLSGIVSSTVTKLTSKGKINSNLLYYYLLLNFEWIQNRRTGTGVPHVPKDLGRILHLRYPKNVNIQNKIVIILETIDESIKNTEALVEKYQNIKKGLMHDLFMRGIDSNGKLRPTREQAPELYQETSIGWIPKEWDLKLFEDVAQIIDPQPDHRTPPEQIDGIPYIGIGDFDDFGALDIEKCRKIIPAAYEKQRQRFIAQTGDIIFGKIGTIGKPKVLSNEYFAVSANVLLIKPLIDSSYLRHCLDTNLFMKQISDVTNTTSQPALGIEKVRNLFIPSPTDENEMKKISLLLDDCDSKLSKNFIYLHKLKMQKSGLMHDLLTGKVPVKIDEPEAAHV